jgi:DNA repair protein RecN (Recombination protein N)
MLEELSVRDFALIDRLSLSFAPGLTILSGETGAGKSLLVGAIGFILGARADTAVIRTGAEEALVIAVLDVSRCPEALAWLAERGMEPEDGRVIIRRGIKSTGRGSILIQGQPALRADLAALTGLLVDLHGQHEHQSLLLPENHRRILDRFARLEEEVAAYGLRFAELSAKRRSFESALASEKERSRDIELLRHAVAEIEGAKLRRGEDQELEAEERLLSQHEKLHAAVDGAHAALAEEEGGAALASLRRARSALEQAGSIDLGLADLARRADDAFYELEDIADSLRHYLGAMRYNPERLEEIEGRLAEIGRLRKKYGGDLEAVLSRLEEDRGRLLRLETWEEDKEGLAREIAELEREVLDEALRISARRTEAARDLEGKIEAILRTLGMPRSRFIVRVSRKEEDAGKAVVGPQGIDEVEFVIAPNPGEAPRSLARIASGGELSRVALAAKTVLAASDTVATLIFDEVDSGIGGEVAVAVGEHLSALGAGRQVLCITHLASIAVRADTHYRVEKDVSSGRTQARLSRIDGRARAEEIARMLAGDPEEESSVLHATELLRKYGKWREG